MLKMINAGKLKLDVAVFHIVNVWVVAFRIISCLFIALDFNDFPPMEARHNYNFTYTSLVHDRPALCT
jgi:uncharacterized protein involved in cysteine biosynthesis